MVEVIALASIAFNRPRLISEQIRLLKKNLKDEFVLNVVDQSSDERMAVEIREVVIKNIGCVYTRLKTRMHHEGLNFAAKEFLSEEGLVMPYFNTPYFGFLDHDVFPIYKTRLTPLIEETGFYGVGQRHPATGHLYLWPGFCFFSREWLNGRPLDFSGIRDGDKRNDGDTGSAMWPLFKDEEWEKMYRAEHSYQPIRKPDAYGLQSWGVERIGDWIHFSNGSNWMRVPDPDGRERLLLKLLAAA